MRPALLTLLLALLPLLFGLYINATAPQPPTRAYDPTRCTRACMAHGCRHATADNSPAFFRLRPLYGLTIRGLSVSGSGAAYVLLNLLFYLLLVPGLLVWLTYGALRDAGRIRQLKQLRA